MRTEVLDAVPATALVADLRGFTAELSRTHGRPVQRRVYCGFLASMNAAVVQSATLALDPRARAAFRQHVHVASTGDGALLVFRGDGHPRAAYLAALLLNAALSSLCAEYARTTEAGAIDFGIGVESGSVTGVGAHPEGDGVSLATVVGGCINAAARVQDLTKVVHRTNVLLCNHVVEALTTDLLHQDYRTLMEGALVPAGSIDDDTYLALETRMVELNRRLCLQFLHHHLLRGFDGPQAIFRVSMSSAVLGNPRFEALLDGLVQHDRTWRDDVRRALAPAAGGRPTG